MNSQRDYEIDNITGLNHEGQHANTPTQRLTATSIIGDTVENSAGEALGKIENLMVNVNSGCIEYAVLEFGSFLGLGGKLFAIPFDQLHLDERRECFVLKREKSQLKNMPGFDKNHWPDTNNHIYYGEVNRYWLDGY